MTRGTAAAKTCRSPISEALVAAGTMELRHLCGFVAAAEEAHFGRAAHRLHVTRPAVSTLIADLETELGTNLFERAAHGVRLTEARRALLPHLQGIITDLNEAFAWRVVLRIASSDRSVSAAAPQPSCIRCSALP